jgi:hypothetical protein
MANYRITKPRITWGFNLLNTLSVGYLLDNVRAGPQPRAGSTTAQSPSGVGDAWTVGTDYLLAFDLRWIPQVDTAVPLATGWDGATGVAEFLRSARDMNLFRFWYDAATNFVFNDCYLVEPMTGYGDPEPDGTRRLSMVIRSYTGTRFDGY